MSLGEKYLACLDAKELVMQRLDALENELPRFANPSAALRCKIAIQAAFEELECEMVRDAR